MFGALVPVNNQTGNSMAGEMIFPRNNFAIFVRIQDPAEFQELPIPATVLDQDINEINFTTVNFSSASVEDILASVQITSELFDIFQGSTPPDEFPRLLLFAHGVNSPLFQDPNPERNATGGIILSVRQSEMQSSIAPNNLSQPVKFRFQTTRVISGSCEHVIISVHPSKLLSKNTVACMGGVLE